MTTDERRRAIVRVLCTRKRETRENLAFEFNVGLRTIARDITALSFEYPIYTTTGPGGGVCIDKSFEMRDGRLSTKEQAVLKGKMKSTMLFLIARKQRTRCLKSRPQTGS